MDINEIKYLVFESHLLGLFTQCRSCHQHCIGKIAHHLGSLVCVKQECTHCAPDKYRICSRHFITGKPAFLYEVTHPNWLPTLHLGHTKVKAVNTDRYERIQKRNAVLEMEGQLPAIVEAEIEAVVRNEVETLVMKQLDKAKQYFKPPTTATCEEVDLLHNNLVVAEYTIDQLKAELAMAKTFTAFSERGL